MYNNLGTLRDIIRVVNGKTVVLIKATDELHSKVAGVTKYLKTMNRDLQTWKTVLNRQFLKLRCTDSMLHEFTSKHSYQLSRAFIGLLRLFELQDLLHQASQLQNKELVGYSSFPGFMAADISARLSTLPFLALTTKGLNSGFPLLIEPMVDYSFPDSKTFVLNILFTVPEIPHENSFCTLTITKGKNVSDIALSPLEIYHFPCDVKFPDQRTGLGDCPKRLTVDIPIFTDSTIRYVPWEDIMDDTIPTLHLESLKIPRYTV